MNALIQDVSYSLSDGFIYYLTADRAGIMGHPVCRLAKINIVNIVHDLISINPYFSPSFSLFDAVVSL